MPKFFRYVTLNKRSIVAIEDCEVFIGTPKTNIKTGKDGYNHNDLGHGAMLNFMSWPPQQKTILPERESISIEPFTAYFVKGKHKTIDAGENEEYMLFVS